MLSAGGKGPGREVSAQAQGSSLSGPAPMTRASAEPIVPACVQATNGSQQAVNNTVTR